MICFIIYIMPLFCILSMSRTKKNRTLQQQMCARLVELIDRHLKITDAEAATALGYRDASILWKVRRGGAFVDAEKLSTLARIGPRDTRVNIHWLITGDGPPTLPPNRGPSGQTRLNRTLSRLSPAQLRAIETAIAALLDSPNRKRELLQK
jgi:hypothetical protein